MSIVKTFLKDSFWTIGAQGVSLLTSIIVSFILPKFITVEQFGYWQYFLLWTGYVGVLHFGYGDGIYLKMGGQYWASIDRSRWMPQMQTVVLVQLLLAAATAVGALTLCSSEAYMLIFLATAAYLVVENTYKIITMAMMATDQIPFVSKTVIVDKLLMALLTAALIMAGNQKATYVMEGYIIAHLAACIMAVGKSKLFCRFYIPSKTSCREIASLCKTGFILMLANFASILTMGLCRLAVEYYWDIEEFSKLSFSITIASFLLFFISQVGYVLFPVLKRIKAEAQATLFATADFIMTMLPILFYVLFFAMYFFVMAWLPKYEESLQFLAFTAPCICLETRVVILYNTYFKNLGKIKPLLYINLVTVAFAIICYSWAVWLHSIDLIALGILLAEVLKVVVMQRMLRRTYDIPTQRVSLLDAVNTVGFVASYYYLGVYAAMGWYALILCVIAIFFREETLKTIVKIKNIR